MQLKSKKTEPETLRVHREMYERRLRDMETGSTSSKDEVDAANSPAVLDHQDSERENEPPSKKAALAG